MPYLEDRVPMDKGRGVEGHVLFIDAYDSFAENIIAMLRQDLNVQVTSIKIDETQVYASQPSNALACYLDQFNAVVVGPGPGHPANTDDIGIARDIWKLQDQHILPVLGICLGFQSLCLAFGASISRLPLPCHGQVQRILHTQTDIFRGVGDVEATNYHSLHITLDKTPQPVSQEDNTLSQADDSAYGSRSSSSRGSSFDLGESTKCSAIQELAFTQDNVLMAARHRTKPFWGLQFHPESCKSGSTCRDLIRNWWHLSKAWNKKNSRIPRPDVLSHMWQPSEAVPGTSPPKLEAAGQSNEDSRLSAHFHDLTEDCVPYVTTLPIEYSDDLSVRILQLTEEAPKGMTACLESTKGGRYSIFSAVSRAAWRDDYWSSSSSAIVDRTSRSGSLHETRTFRHVDVFTCIRKLTIERRIRSNGHDSPFWGGFMGYVSYEIGLEKFNISEEHDSLQADEPPDLSFLWSERSIILDHQTRTAWLQSILRDDLHWLQQMALELEQAPNLTQLQNQDLELESSLQNCRTTLPNADLYKKHIRDCQEYLRAGDSYELCLTADTEVSVPRPVGLPDHDSSNALALYFRLRKRNPVPFAAYMSLGNVRIVSASPEQFMSWSRGGEINMIPMKGTVKKGPEMTFSRASEILASPKEQAENLMIADLIRHDLHSLFGAVSNVDVVKLCDVVEHETVYQLVSHIRTTIPPVLDVMEDRQTRVLTHGQRALISTLPPGSMTGAPKKRSCEILSQLENRRRGIYSGAIGYIDLGGAGAFSVCIRTAFSHSQPGQDSETWRIGAGGAITVLSDEEAEWEEMKTKLDSVMSIFKNGSIE